MLREPLRPQPNLQRRIYVTKDIASALDGETNLPRFPEGNVDAILTGFMAGHVLTFSDKVRKWGKRGRGPVIEQLNGLEEIWALCFRAPPPGYRLLGRFLDHEVFVGLKLIEKFDLAGRYEEEAKDVIASWEALFSIEPHRSPNVDGYLRNWVEYE